MEANKYQYQAQRTLIDGPDFYTPHDTTDMRRAFDVIATYKDATGNLPADVVALGRLIAAALAAAYERGREDALRERQASYDEDYDFERQSEILRGLHSRGS